MAASNNTNLAAEFLVASHLFRLGYTVTITLGNTKEVDLLVSHPDGRTLSIDVKGLKNKTNWPLNPKMKRKTHFFVFVAFCNNLTHLSKLPEFYIIPSTCINSFLSKWSGRPSQNCIPYGKIRGSKYQDAWSLLFP